MIIKTIIDEDFVNYKKPSMYIAMPNCDFKCCREANISIEICQNSQIAKEKNLSIDDKLIIERYLKNNITNAIVLSGLEPFLSFNDIYKFISLTRQFTNDDVVIYTGYYENEIVEYIKQLKIYKNIIVKFGRYIPQSVRKYDETLGVYLISENQYAIKIS